MNINIELKRNFVNAYNKMQSEYGEEMAAINGFAPRQLSYTDFIDNFIDSHTVADASVDGNANVGQKDIVTLVNEMPKPHQKLLAFTLANIIASGATATSLLIHLLRAYRIVVA